MEEDHVLNVDLRFN